MRHRFYLLLLAISVFCTLALCLIWVFVNPDRGTLWFELSNALIQVVVVAVIGALVSVFSFEYRQERQDSDKKNEEKRQRFDQARDLERRRLEYREDLLKATLARAMDSYSDVKKARRLLRARAVIQRDEAKPEQVLGTVYDEYMEMVNDAQLSFEALEDDVRTSRQAFTKPDQLEADFDLIEKYLGSLTSEYEQERRTFQGSPSSQELASLRDLSRFLKKPKSIEFDSQVVEPYHRVQRNIRSDLLHPQLPKADGTSD